MGDTFYLVDIYMKNVKREIVVILFALLSILITCKLMMFTKYILMKHCAYKVNINMSTFNLMSKMYQVVKHIYIYCIYYRSVIFYTSEKGYNQVDFYNLILSLVNQLINVVSYIRLERLVTNFIMYYNVQTLQVKGKN